MQSIFMDICHSMCCSRYYNISHKSLKKQIYPMTDQVKNSTNIQELQHSKPQTPQSQVSKLQRILQKPFESRYGSENQYIANLIKQNIALSKLAQQISNQFVKNIFKSAIVVNPAKDSVICMNGQKIEELGIVLTGQVALIRDEEEDNQVPNISNDEIFDKLLQNAKLFAKQLRKKQSSVTLQFSKKILPISQKDFQPIKSILSMPITSQNIDSYINPNQFLGWKDRSMSQTFKKTCVCLNDETSILLFKQSNVMIQLEVALKQKIKKIANLLKGVPCFNILDIDRMNLVIQNMVLRKKKKFDYIYKQGQKNSSIYLLTQGEIKITKEADLFEQNPNNLHGNRKKLVQQTLTNSNKEADKVQKIFIDKKVKKSMLPYANLTTMYNFRPMKKTIQIGVVTPFSLFGEEEYSLKKTRDTNAMCSSLTAQYYEITINKLEEIVGNKILPIFEKQMRDFVRKKVLYRQSQYATSVNFQNNNNLDYFYLQDGKQKESPRKFRISKFNNMLESNKSSPTSNRQQISNNATYTTFNFNKMKKSSQTDRKPIKNQIDQEEQQHYEKTTTQLKIMDMTHTWQLMKEKVDMAVRASKKISPFKPTINLKKPLIASDYFIHVEKQSRRIDRQHRKRIASLNRSYKLSRVTDKLDPSF